MKKFLPALLLLALPACSTTRNTYPSRTATEQMLISEAAEQAVGKLTLAIPEGRKCYLDVTNFEGVDAKYAISAIRQRLMEQGISLVDDKTVSDTVIEVRSGALSIDSKGTTIMLPGIAVNNITPSVESNVTINQYTRFTDTGVAVFRAFAYDRATGKLLSQAEVAVGKISHRKLKR
jgi:hypothetical protein